MTGKKLGFGLVALKVLKVKIWMLHPHHHTITSRAPMFQKKRGFILKIDYGLLRVIGLKYDIKSPFDFEILIFSLLPFIVPLYS